jgi:LL-diaminopimelate aminotransferase
MNILSKGSSNFPINKLETNFFATLNNRVAELTASGVDVIRLDIGSPDLPPAPHIIETLIEFAQNPNCHGYQSHRGTPALRDAWAKLYERGHNLILDPQWIVPLLGSKEGVFHLSLAILNPGDIVLVPDPGYQTYAQGAYFAGAQPIRFSLLPGNDYLPDFSSLPAGIAREAKILWLNYPNNPTGAIAPLDFFSQAVEFCRQYDILLCHDAAYTMVTFDDYYAPSVLEVPGAAEIALEFNTLSKTYNMAGWRLGAAVGNPEALDALLRLKTHADSGHFRPVIEAAIAAMLGDQSWLVERNTVYRQRRDVVIAALRGMGLAPQEPQASLYVWCPLPGGWDSTSLVLKLLDQANISLAPGSFFGPSGNDYLRISLTQPLQRIRDGMERMAAWLRVSA